MKRNELDQIERDIIKIRCRLANLEGVPQTTCDDPNCIPCKRLPGQCPVCLRPVIHHKSGGTSWYTCRIIPPPKPKPELPSEADCCGLNATTAYTRQMVNAIIRYLKARKE